MQVLDSSWIHRWLVMMVPGTLGMRSTRCKTQASARLEAVETTPREARPVGTVGAAWEDGLGLARSLGRSRNVGTCRGRVHYSANFLPDSARGCTAAATCESNCATCGSSCAVSTSHRKVPGAGSLAASIPRFDGDFAT